MIVCVYRHLRKNSKKDKVAQILSTLRKGCTLKTGVRGSKIRVTETRGAEASNHSTNGKSTKTCSTDIKRDG